eukprot:4622729-Prymnesium_polylepis.1
MGRGRRLERRRVAGARVHTHGRAACGRRARRRGAGLGPGGSALLLELYSRQHRVARQPVARRLRDRVRVLHTAVDQHRLRPPPPRAGRGRRRRAPPARPPRAV